MAFVLGMDHIEVVEWVTGGLTKLHYLDPKIMPAICLDGAELIRFWMAVKELKCRSPRSQLGK